MGRGSAGEAGEAGRGRARGRTGGQTQIGVIEGWQGGLAAGQPGGERQSRGPDDPINKAPKMDHRLNPDVTARKTARLAPCHRPEGPGS